MAFRFDKTHHSVVIGSNGAIGSACVKALKKSGANVFEICPPCNITYASRI